jgi:small subunit ribosomal protein S20
MAHTKSALKRSRQNERLRVKNKGIRSDVKTQIKSLRAAITAKDAKAIATQVRLTQGKLDKAAKHRVIHPNAAARIKSRIAHRVAGAAKK